MIRLVKIILVIFVGLNGLLYFADNILNWEAARGAVGAVIAMGDRPWYPNALIPSLTGNLAATIALLIILTGEFLVGAISLKGALDMLGKKGAPAAEFNASKKHAILGCAMALVVWFGGFTVIGGGLFQMWQTELGQASLNDAMKFYLGSTLVLFFVAMKDE